MGKDKKGSEKKILFNPSTLKPGADPVVERKKALDTALASIDKAFGKGSIMKMGTTTTMAVEVIPSGCLELDLALGVGGIPRGRIIEIYGPEASGKTTIALQMIASVQKTGGVAAFIDAEHALDPKYAKVLGVDVDEMYVSQPDYGEQALEICEALVRSGAVDIIVIDSVAAIVPKVEIEGDMGDAQVGAQARLMSKALRKLSGVISKTRCICVFINQLREKVGIMFGNPETTAGGKALKFYATIRLDVRSKDPIKEGTTMIGKQTIIKVVKNKVAPPFRTCMVDMIFGQGISHEGSLVSLAVEADIINKSGAWFSYNGERIGQGKENARLYLVEHPDIAKEIEQKIRESIQVIPAITEDSEDTESDDASALDDIFEDSTSDADLMDEAEGGSSDEL